MDIRQLEIFSTVAEELNFSRAADKLYISQPSLSYQIMLLENELGVQLFVRNARYIYLTSAGNLFLDYARKILDATAEVQKTLQYTVDSGAEEKLSLRAAFDRTEIYFESFGVQNRISSFLDENPNVAISVPIYPAEECMKKLETNELDLAFLILRYNEKLNPLLQYRTVREDQIVLAYQHDGTLHTCAEVLAKHKLLFSADHTRGQKRLLRSLKNAGIEPNIAFVESYPESLILAQSGAGCFPIASSFFDSYRAHNLDLLPVPGNENRIFYSAVWNKSNQNPALAALLDVLKERS